MSDVLMCRDHLRLRSRSNGGGTSWLRMSAVLLEHKGEMLSDEFGARHPTLARCSREEPIVRWIPRDGRRFLPRQCHRSNMTR